MSPLFAGNDGFLPICKSCADKYFAQLIDFFCGNEEKALDRMCSIFDWYYSEDVAAATRKVSANRTRIGLYPSKLNLWKAKGTTYLDTLTDRFGNTIDTQDELEAAKKEDGVNVSNVTIRRWGLGYSPEEYDALNVHYKTLRDQADSGDIVTDSLIKDLCSIKVQQMRMLQQGDVDKYSKLTELYQKTLSSANLKPKSIKDANAANQTDAYGVWLKDIEKFAPADYFKDKEIYKDHDGLGEYFQRFIVRPFRNLITGSKEMDYEFSVDRSSELGDGEDAIT